MSPTPIPTCLPDSHSSTGGPGVLLVVLCFAGFVLGVILVMAISHYFGEVFDLYLRQCAERLKVWLLSPQHVHAQTVFAAPGGEYERVPTATEVQEYELAGEDGHEAIQQWLARRENL